MRKIIQAIAPHNARVLWTLAAAFLLVAQTGCQGGGKEESNGQVTACSVIVDSGSWMAFDDLATRTEAGEPVTDEGIEAFMALPGTSLWVQAMPGFSPSVLNMANWFDAAFADGDRAAGKPSGNRSVMIRNYRYSHGLRDLVNESLATFGNEKACQLDSMITFWIDPDKRPTGSLPVFFLPGLPEVRIHNDSLIVDTGILAAAGPDQIVRQITSLIYRNRMEIPGHNPAHLNGAESVAQAYRLVTNEAMTSWITQISSLLFRDDHPKFGAMEFIPEDLYYKAIDGLDRTNTEWLDILADSDRMAAEGKEITGWFMGQNAFMAMGFCMASTIEGHLGPERLRGVARSVPGFLAAYQEAALLNPVPRPAPGSVGQENYQSMPPLEPEAFAGLHGLLKTAFPE